MDRPNIVFVFSDQHRYEAVACNGNTVIRTPNMDRLAADGMNCSGALSSHPLCSPYRAQLLTAQYGWKNGVIDNEYKLRDGIQTVAHRLGAAGYGTYYVGKWHLGPSPYPAEKRYGFDTLSGHGGTPFFDGEFFKNEEEKIQLKGWTPTGATDLALGYMTEHREATPDRPLALFLSWQPPHWPYDKFPPEFDIYDPASVPIPDNVPREMEPFAREEIARYYGNVTALDAELGKVLAFIDDHGMRENTILCYTSDHGDHLSSHGYVKPERFWAHPHKRGSKGSPHEESVHVPFILRYPGVIPAGSVSLGLFGTVDIMPSIFGLAELEFRDDDGQCDGVNLAAGFGGGSVWRQSVYLMNMGLLWPYRDPSLGCWRGVRTERYTYARWIEGDQGPILFDRENDPAELTNLASDPALSSVLTEMEGMLREHMERSNDPFESGSRNPVTGELELGLAYASERWANYEVPPLHERLGRDPWKRPPDSRDG